MILNKTGISTMRNITFILLLCGINVSIYASQLGKTTYEMACQNCHSPKLAIGMKAPAAFDKAAWDARFANAALEAKNNPTKYKSAMDYLLYSVKIGKGLMHHGGLCHEANMPNKDCSDEALMDAIDYMRKP